MNNLFESFKKRWHKKSEEFKKLELDGQACMSIYNGFLEEYLYLMRYVKKESIQNFYLEREQLANDIKEALDVAFCNHKRFLRRTSWRYKLFSGNKKLDFSMFKFPKP